MSATSSLSSIYQPSTPPSNPKSQLKSEDFINLLITQLQNQDPLQPMKNNELLQQVSQIGQLQSQTSLTSSLEQMTLQNQISGASGMIGHVVAGKDERGGDVVGIVTSVRVVDKEVTLELDDGTTLPLSRVTDVGPQQVGAVTPPTGNTNTNTDGLTGGLTTGLLTPPNGTSNLSGLGSGTGLTGGLNTGLLTPKNSGAGIYGTK